MKTWKLVPTKSVAPGAAYAMVVIAPDETAARRLAVEECGARDFTSATCEEAEEGVVLIAWKEA